MAPWERITFQQTNRPTDQQTNRPTDQLEVPSSAVVFLVVVAHLTAAILATEIDLAEFMGEVDAEASEGDEEGTLLFEVFTPQVADEGLVFGEGLNDSNTQGRPVAELIVSTDAEDAESGVGTLKGLPTGPEEAEGINAELVTELEAAIDVTTGNVGAALQFFSVSESSSVVTTVICPQAKGEDFSQGKGGKEVDADYVTAPDVKEGGRTGKAVVVKLEEALDESAGLSEVDRTIDDHPFDVGVVGQFILFDQFRVQIGISDL
jgi:hypothetical protein